MGTRSDWLAILGMPLGFALPCGVKMTALGLDEGTGSSRLWAGLPLIAAGVLGVECIRWCVAAIQTVPDQWASGPGEARQVVGATRALEAAALVLLLVATVLQFALLLDGHVRLRGCGWLLVAYAVGAGLVWVGRQGATRWGACYLRWGWAPLIAFGVPLGLPALLAAGLVSPIIPSG